MILKNTVQIQLIKVNSRLIHLISRIQWILRDNDFDNDVVIKFKNEAFATSLKFEAYFDKVQESDHNTHLNNNISDPNIVNTTSYCCT